MHAPKSASCPCSPAFHAKPFSFSVVLYRHLSISRFEVCFTYPSLLSLFLRCSCCFCCEATKIKNSNAFFSRLSLLSGRYSAAPCALEAATWNQRPPALIGEATWIGGNLATRLVVLPLKNPQRDDYERRPLTQTCFEDWTRVTFLHRIPKQQPLWKALESVPEGKWALSRRPTRRYFFV